jgi:hypothetical protein
MVDLTVTEMIGWVSSMLFIQREMLLAHLLPDLLEETNERKFPQLCPRR